MFFFLQKKNTKVWPEKHLNSAREPELKMDLDPSFLRFWGTKTEKGGPDQ